MRPRRHRQPPRARLARGPGRGIRSGRAAPRQPEPQKETASGRHVRERIVNCRHCPGFVPIVGTAVLATVGWLAQNQDYGLHLLSV